MWIWYYNHSYSLWLGIEARSGLQFSKYKENNSSGGPIQCWSWERVRFAISGLRSTHAGKHSLSLTTPQRRVPSPTSDFYFICIYGCFNCTFVCVPHACQVPTEVRREGYSSWNRRTKGCDQPCGCWQSNQGPLEDQPVFLTAKPSPSGPSVSFIA